MRWMRAFILAVVGLAVGFWLGPELPGTRAVPASIGVVGSGGSAFAAAGPVMIDPRVQACLARYRAEWLEGTLMVDASGVSFVPEVVKGLPRPLVRCIQGAIQASPMRLAQSPRSVPVVLARLYDHGGDYAFTSLHGDAGAFVTASFSTTGPVLLDGADMDFFVSEAWSPSVAFSMPVGTYATWSEGVVGKLEITGPGHHTWDVDHWEVYHPPTPRSALAAQVRVIPHRGADGSLDGVRLSGIRRSSGFAQMGLHNGDVIESVDGLSLTDPSNWDELAEAPSGSIVAVKGRRRGEPLLLDVVIP